MAEPAYPDHYEALRLAPTATTREIDAAYRARANDRDPTGADAYAVLSSPASRALYDRLALGIAPASETGTASEPERVAQPSDDRAARYIAAAALVVSIVFLIAVLLA